MKRISLLIMIATAFFMGCSNESSSSKETIISGNLASSLAQSISKASSASLLAPETITLVEVLSDSGEVLGSSSDFSNDSKRSFQISGNFSEKILKMRFSKAGKKLEYHLGRFDGSIEVQDLGDIDVEAEVLVSRFLQNSKRFDQYKKLDFSTMKEIRNEMKKFKLNSISENSKTDLLLDPSSISIGVDGVVTKGTRSFPEKYDHPQRNERDWEKEFVNRVRQLGIPLEEESVTGSAPSEPIPADLVTDLLDKLTVITDQEQVIYDSSVEIQTLMIPMYYVKNNVSFDLKIELKDVLMASEERQLYNIFLQKEHLHDMGFVSGGIEPYFTQGTRKRLLDLNVVKLSDRSYQVTVVKPTDLFTGAMHFNFRGAIKRVESGFYNLSNYFSIQYSNP
ncbi:hypothetical protein MJH12_15060 [bacterium]|nr:hypothetical protein [bacterium]